MSIKVFFLKIIGVEISIINLTFNLPGMWGGYYDDDELLLL